MKNVIFTVIISMFLVSCWSHIVEEKTSSSTKEKPSTIIALWDSLTAWYNLDISDSYPSQLEDILDENNYNYKIINAGVSWDTSKNLLDRIDLYDETPAEIYMLTIGGNDALRRQSIDDMVNNIQKIIDSLQLQNPDATIVLSGMQIPINYGLSYASNYKKAFETLADKNNLEFYEFFLEWVAQDSKLNLSDGIHPNAQGYKIIANNLYDFLESEKIIQK